MPPGHRPPIPPGYARVALSGVWQGQPWINAFYLQLAGSGITSADLNTLAGNFGTGWAGNIAGQTTVNNILENVDIVYVPSVGNELTGHSGTTHAGSGGGTDIDNVSSCYVIRWAINAYYRGGHPRTYMAGPITSYVTNGRQLTATALTNLATQWAAYRTTINSYTTTNITGVTLGTMSFQTGNTWRGTPLFRTYQGVSVNPLLGTQRRRIHA